MSTSTSRRDFLLQTGKTGLGLYLGASFLSSCNSSKKIAVGPYGTGFTQTPLAYSYQSLNEAIDAQTMELHYTKHAAGYVTNLNEAARNEGVDTGKPLEDTLARISKYSAKLRNNGGGHYNHELYWKIMSPKGGGKPTGRLATAIDSSFGSFEAFQTALSDAGKNRFGSGWAWLVVDADKRLRIGSTPNQDNPVMDIAEIKGQPLMGLDVWEHAYYLRYQNKRADYIASWWKVVNWNYIGERYQSFVPA